MNQVGGNGATEVDHFVAGRDWKEGDVKCKEGTGRHEGVWGKDRGGVVIRVTQAARGREKLSEE